jgi:hypothetical protein
MRKLGKRFYRALFYHLYPQDQNFLGRSLDLPVFSMDILLGRSKLGALAVNNSDVLSFSRREQFVQWAETLVDRQTPAWLGLPNNAEKVLLTNLGEYILQDKFS